MAPTCSYFMCPTTTADKKAMFRFPFANPRRLQMWIANCGNMTISHLTPEKLRNKCICIDHFDKKFVVFRGHQTVLTREAVPNHFTWEDAPTSDSTSQGRDSPELRVLAPRKVYMTRKQNGDDKGDNIHISPIRDECESWRDDDIDGSWSIADDGDMVNVEAELIDGESTIPSGLLAPTTPELFSELRGQETSWPSPIRDEATEPVIKEELIEVQEHPPETERNYKALYFTMKDEMSRLTLENQRLSEENHNLTAKNKILTESVENLLRNNAGHSNKKKETIQLLKKSNLHLNTLNSRLSKDIEALRADNKAYKQQLGVLNELNTCLLERAQQTQKRKNWSSVGGSRRRTHRGTKGSGGRDSPELRVIAPRKVYMTRKQNGDDGGDSTYKSPVRDECDDVDGSWSIADDEEMAVKAEIEDETSFTADDGDMVNVEAEPINGESPVRDECDDVDGSWSIADDEEMAVKAEIEDETSFTADDGDMVNVEAEPINGEIKPQRSADDADLLSGEWRGWSELVSTGRPDEGTQKLKIKSDR